MALVQRNSGITDRVVDQLARARDQRGGKVEACRDASEATVALPDLDVVHDALLVHGEVVPGRHLARQGVDHRGVLQGGDIGRDADLRRDGANGAVLVLGVEQQLVGAVHGSQETGQEHGLGLAAQGQLPNGEGT